MDIENRLIDLEIKISHQDKQIEDLSEVIQQQQNQINLLQRSIDLLSAKIQTGSSSELEIRGGDEKPPHY